MKFLSLIILALSVNAFADPNMSRVPARHNPELSSQLCAHKAKSTDSQASNATRKDSSKARQ